MQTAATERWRSVKSIAEQLDVTPMTIRRAIDAGDLTAYRVGTGRTAAWRVKPEDLVAWLEAGRNVTRESQLSADPQVAA